MSDAAHASPASALKTPVRVSGPVFFISDLHLTATMPATAAAFERFMRTRARAAHTLVILGDFFEYWVGDEELADPFHHYCDNIPDDWQFLLIKATTSSKHSCVHLISGRLVERQDLRLRFWL